MFIINLSRICFLFLAVANANEELKKDSEQKPFRFKEKISINTSSDFLRSSDPEHSVLMSFRARSLLSYNAYQLGVPFILNQSLNRYQRDNPALGDSPLSWSHTPLELSSTLSLTPALISLIPLSKRSRNVESLRLGLGLSPNIEYSPFPFLSLGYQLLLMKNIHLYESDTSGESNIEWQLSHSIDITYKVIESFSVIFGASYQTDWTYQHNSSASYGFSGEVSWDFLKKSNISLGVSNAGDVLRPNMQDTNISLFNVEDARYYIDLSYQLL